MRRSDGTDVSVEIGLVPATIGGTTFIATGIRDVTTRLRGGPFSAPPPLHSRPGSRRRTAATIDVRVIGIPESEDDAAYHWWPKTSASVWLRLVTFADFLGLPIDEVVGMDLATFRHPEEHRLDQVATKAQLSGSAATCQ